MVWHALEFKPGGRKCLSEWKINPRSRSLRRLSKAQKLFMCGCTCRSSGCLAGSISINPENSTILFRLYLQVKRPSGRKKLKRMQEEPKEQDAEEMRHELFGSEGVCFAAFHLMLLSSQRAGR